MTSLKKIGVIGAGQMGSGIAHVCALGGFDVRLSDIDAERLEQAVKGVEKNLFRQAGKGKITKDDAIAALTRIKTAVGMGAFKDCDLVIEAATEDENIKKSILKDLCPNLKKDALIATNTSSISITRLAAVTDRPAKFVGLHFMNPVPIMALVELIRGIATSPETYSTVSELVGALGKTPVESEDFPAFIINRILIPMVNEAVFALHEGVGTPQAIDTAMKLGARHPMGPLELADFIGLDTCLAIMNTLLEGFADSKYRPCPLLVKYVEAGRLGRKTGQGFYDYS